jgi:ADP-ribosylglycohydrolase
MPANPSLDYVMCPDGSTAIGDNCGSAMPLAQQEAIAYARIQSDPIFQAAVEAERPIMTDDQTQMTALAPVEKSIDTKTIFIVLGVALLGLYLINKQD